MFVAFQLAFVWLLLTITPSIPFDVSTCFDASSSITCRFLSPFGTQSPDENTDCTNAFTVHSSTQDYIRRRLQLFSSPKPTPQATLNLTSLPKSLPTSLPTSLPPTNTPTIQTTAPTPAPSLSPSAGTSYNYRHVILVMIMFLNTACCFGLFDLWVFCFACCICLHMISRTNTEWMWKH